MGGEMKGQVREAEVAHGAASIACLNCRALLVGRFCHVCGQQRGPTHRSLLDLAGETIEAFTHGDSRVLRTVRLLAFNPGRLTRDWLDGRRVRDVPPVRIFFVALFVLFLMASFGGIEMHVGHGAPPGDWTRQLVIAKHPGLTAWLQHHVGHAASDPKAIVREMGTWVERLVLLMLPIAAVTLKLLFVGRRPRVPLYDHVVFGLHSLAFGMLLIAALMQVDRLLGDDVQAVLCLLIPVHVFRHLRGTYGGGRWATATRTIMLLGAEFVGLTGIVVALALIGLEWG
ncbi:DUF3667 domain-containing protein [Lichenicoccus sp.]|uniref:DUF3667 domain-containing protein n=1 Tax=Lichenicoccus sp. TaxID=2781899 RepID=UPI003D1208E8